MRGRERGANLRAEVDDALEGQGTLLRDQVSELDALEQLHHDVAQPVVVLPEVEDPADVGVIEPRGRARFAVEVLDELRVAGEVLVEELHGDGTVQQPVASSVDPTDRAARDLRLDLVLRTTQQPPSERVVDGRLRRGVRGVFRKERAQGGLPLPPERAEGQREARVLTRPRELGEDGELLVVARAGELERVAHLRLGSLVHVERQRRLRERRFHDQRQVAHVRERGDEQRQEVVADRGVRVRAAQAGVRVRGAGRVYPVPDRRSTRERWPRPGGRGGPVRGSSPRGGSGRRRRRPPAAARLGCRRRTEPGSLALRAR